jgi:hypothetical protein
MKVGSRILRASTLERLGGAERIVADHLQRALGALTPEEEEAASRAFSYLVTPSGTKIAHTVNDLAGWAGVPSEALASILQRLAGPEARVLRAAALNTPDGETRYEITHDILAPAILDWVRLRSAERLRAEAERQRRLARNLKGLTIGVSVSALVCVMIATLAFIEFLRERQSARDNQHAALEIKRLTAERDQIIASAKPPLTSRRYDLEFTETAAPPRESPRVSAGAKGTTQPSKKPDPPGSSQIVPADAAVVRSDKVPSIAIVSQTTNVGAEDLNQVAAALQIQVQRDLIPKWGIDAKIRSYQKLVDVPLDAWPVLLKDASGAVSGAYHSVRNGVPFALVVFSEDWTLDMSHQILEILVDSLGNRFTTAPSIDPDDKGALVQYLVQICDPVEDARFSYEIHGVKVSDFVLPAFYDSAAISGPFSFTVRPARPLQVLPGGYISFRNPATDEWKQVIVNADGKSQIRKLGKISK